MARNDYIGHVNSQERIPLTEIFDRDIQFTRNSQVDGTPKG